MGRPSWDDTGMKFAMTISERSVCKHHQVGCCFIDTQHRTAAMGYNGPPRGVSHCDEVGCAKTEGDPQTGETRRCRGAHAEMNAIMNAYDSRQLAGSTLYITVLPCYDCLKHLVNLQVARIVYLEEYERVTSDGKTEHEAEVWELAKITGIKIVRYDQERRCG